MFLNGHRWYGRDGEQRARGSFLILFSAAEKAPGRCCRELRALVRHASLSQCGHFMMGAVHVALPSGKVRIGLSGTYGDDGLPCDAPAELWERLHPVPQEIAEVYWHDNTGHNSAGREAESMHEWAKNHMRELSRLRPTGSEPCPT